jgi:hypothetical protein
MYEPNENSTACKVCIRGHFCSQGSSTPQGCPSGTWSSAIGLTSSARCLICPVGSYCRTGSSVPSICPAGRYGDVEGLADSLCAGACSTGHFCESGSTNGTSVPCPAGRENTLQGSGTIGSCRECAVGFAAPLQGAESCDKCEPGKHASFSGAVACSICAAGSYARLSGTIVCDACRPGTFQPDAESTNCLDCPRGKAETQSGATSCTSCFPGKYQWLTAQESCASCDVGKFNPRLGGGADGEGCDDCPPGSFMEQRGAPLCSPCAPGWKVAISGARACVPCSVGMYSAAGADGCMRCGGVSGTDTALLSDAHTEPGSSPLGINCTGGVLHGLLKGYWADLTKQDMTNATGNATQAFACVPAGVCIGGSTNEHVCLTGHRGPLCASCWDGYLRNPQSKLCECNTCVEGYTCSSVSNLCEPTAETSLQHNRSVDIVARYLVEQVGSRQQIADSRH